MRDYYDDYCSIDDYEQIARDIFAAEVRAEFMRSLVGWRNIVKVILPTGTVIFAHRWRPTARTGLRYTGRMRGDIGRGCESA